MAMQIVAVPLFNEDMLVDAYVFRYQNSNPLFSTAQTISIFDGASRSLALETLEMVGLDAFTLGKPIFVPIDHLMLLGDLSRQCQQPPDRVVFLFENVPAPEELYLDKIAELREKGFRFAVSYLDNPEQFGPILLHTSFYFLSQREENIGKSKRILGYLEKNYPDIRPIATHIRSKEMMESLRGTGYTLYESRFFQVTGAQGEHGVAPLKANTIRLLNTIQDENFEFEEITNTVQSDPALTISLMKIINAPHTGSRSKIKTISQAVSRMGQKEVRKWVMTAVSQSLGDDRPNEITRISMVRAKFAENLAPLFDMSHMAQELYLMGLFSVLDIILDVPMEQALGMIQVSDGVRAALLEKSGMYYPVLNMVIDYECAYWSSVSRQMILHDIGEDALAKAYIDALIWYRNTTQIPGDMVEITTAGEEADDAQTAPQPQ